MKIFDIHTHIYPDKIAEKASQAIGHFYNDIYMNGDGRLSSLIEEMKEAHIEGFAAHSVATTPHQVDSINRFILSAQAAYPDMLVPFATLHPDTEDMTGTIKGIVDAGFKGVKLHPDFQQFNVDAPHAIEMFAAIADTGLPVLLHCGDYRQDNSSPCRTKNLKRQLPNLNLICAHLGGWTLWESAAKELIDSDIWVDTSSSLFALDPTVAASIIRGYGIERVLFGTDYPMWKPAVEVQRFLALDLTDAEREDILWNNHLKLFRKNV